MFVAPTAPGGGTHNIEDDARAMVNVKTGTKYTQKLVDSDEATAAAVAPSEFISAAEIPSQQPLKQGRTNTRRLPEQDPNGNPREAASREKIPRVSLSPQQSIKEWLRAGYDRGDEDGGAGRLFSAGNALG